ncbi:dynein intermediate chain 4, axonemal isoform X2 [Syngnathus acus]|uniref:dynein intermediate chain 4, axonemal isoform X2 n=1 Tax=Syngnathus acus TaxID=161584 RepID=UPI001885CB9D|nr:dynein intermediate chain 4, axonemal isoform X2 [Syngnathus acus]
MRRSRDKGSSSRAVRRSTSGMQRMLHSSRYTGSFAGHHSRRGSRMLSESKMGRFAHRKAIRVMDEEGNDVTPRPLYEPEPKDPHAKPQRSFFEDYYSRFDTSKSTSCFYVPSSGTCRWSSSLPSLSARVGSQSAMGYIKLDTSQPLDSVRQTGNQQISEEIAVEEVLNVYLSETETITLLDLPTTCMSDQAEDAQAVKRSNVLYIELCNNRLGNDKYVERAMQTFVGASKNKKLQSDKIVMHDQGTMATIWEIFDSFQTEDSKAEKVPAQSSPDLNKDPKEIGSVSSISTIGTASTGSSLFAFNMQAGDMNDESELQLIFQSETFQRNLLITERCLVANIFQARLASYRNLPEIQEPSFETKPESEELNNEEETEEDEEEELDEMAEEVQEVEVEEQVKEEEQKEEEEEVQAEEEEEEVVAPSLELLWTFSCELTKGWNITSMAWNKQNLDLLAVGYGDFKPWRKGLICCWSIKNLSWPERVYHCHSGITALDFSSTTPDKLAAGMHDGTVAIFSVRNRERRTFLASSIGCKKRHFHPVWNITWAKQEMGLSDEDTIESVVSVSEDGRVLKWLLCSHGLEGVGMLELRRIQDGIKKAEGNKTKREGLLVSTATAGLCLDFQPTDPTIYLAGTSEGVVQKCSVSNHHHYLALYRKHLCPVNQVQWSPFSPDVFLSGSADWTIQLWKEDHLTPAMSFTTIQSPVLSVRWSPLWPSVFASIKSEQLEIWDLNASMLDPVIVEPAAQGVQLTSMLFAKASDCIVVADSSGNVNFYKIKDLSVSPGKTVPSLEELVHFPTTTS